MKDFLKAKELLVDEVRLVLIKGETVIKSTEKGIGFLVSLASENIYQNYSVADTIVGKAAALLYSLMEVKNVYGQTITKKALEILKQENINVEYQILTDNILNRTNSGLCPMELTVLDIEDKKEALIALQNKLSQ